MTPTQKYFIALARSAIFDQAPPAPPQSADWDYLYEKAVEQNVQGLLASAVLNLPQEHLPYNKDKWEKSMLNTMYLMGRKFAEYERIADIFANNGIELILLKGIVIKDYYPVPELRTMGDFDVLTEDQKKICEILKQEDYKTFYSERWLDASNRYTHWEIFSSLESEFPYNTEHYDELIKTNIVPYQKMYRPGDTYFLAFLIVHAAKHILGKGAGIRQICDIAIAMKYMDADIEKVKQICEEQKMLKVYEYIAACAAKDFGIKIDYDKKLNTKIFWEYLLKNGVFGVADNGNRMLEHVSIGDDSVSTWRKIFCPPPELLGINYDYAKKHKILLPIAWIHRLINGLFVRKYSPVQTLKGINEARAFSSEREQWLKKLGLM